MPKTVLVHLNCTVPDGASAESVAAQIMGALEVGIDADNTPDLVPTGDSPDVQVVVALTEEV
jgi:hypothetical protein